jgi:hypothetical protein
MSVVRAIAVTIAAATVLYAALLAVIYFGRNALHFPGAGVAAAAWIPRQTFPTPKM